jgi:uncharacterized membrane protein YhaH (DUF805 family)
MMISWHYQLGDTAKGPVTDDQLKALCEAGVVHGGTLVWQPDFADWMPLSQTDFAFKSLAGPPPVATVPKITASSATLDHAAVDTRSAVENLSLWDYFIRSLTTYYGQFEGRARRKEYWGYQLFYWLTVIALCLLGIAIDALMGNLPYAEGDNAVPFATLSLLGLFFLGTLVPSYAVLIRRLHDVGMTGWLALLILIPYLGGLVLFIFTLLPTEPHTNKHGLPPKANPGVQDGMRT